MRRDGMAGPLFHSVSSTDYVIWVGNFEPSMHFYVKRDRALFPAQAIHVTERGAGHLLDSHH